MHDKTYEPEVDGGFTKYPVPDLSGTVDPTNPFDLNDLTFEDWTPVTTVVPEPVLPPVVVMVPRASHRELVVGFLEANQDNNFFKSLLTQYKAQGTLSPRQWECASKAYDKSLVQPVAPVVPLVALEAGQWWTVGKFTMNVVEGKSGNCYAKTLSPAGRLVYFDGHTKLLKAAIGDGTAVRLVLEDVAALGRKYNRCMVCSRELTDERSIAAGIGPVCAGLGRW